MLYQVNDLRKSTSLFIFLFIAIATVAQPKKYSPANAHSHNDYLNDLPLHRAYKAGFGSIEADVFPVNGRLCVAHTKSEIQLQRTLDSLYLVPLHHAFVTDGGRRLLLLIDVKENYEEALRLLVLALQPLTAYLTTSSSANQLTVIISGNRPPPALYKNYPGFIFFDDDLRQPHTAEEWSRVGLVSMSFTRFSAWRGSGPIPSADRMNLQRTIDSVHNAGKRIRFWAAPDTEAGWLQQMDLKADFIGTDHIEALGFFLKPKKGKRSRKNNTK